MHFSHLSRQDVNGQRLLSAVASSRPQRSLEFRSTAATPNLTNASETTRCRFNSPPYLQGAKPFVISRSTLMISGETVATGNGYLGLAEPCPRSSGPVT